MIQKIIISLLVLGLSLSAEEIYASFSVGAKKSANLAFDSSGRVKKVYVDVSSVVKRGQKLVELVNDDLKASLEVARSSLKSAEVSLKFAKRDYERQLKIKSIIDEAKFDKYEMAYEKAKVGVAQAKANVAYKQSLLDKTTLYAPFNGVIFQKSVEVGDAVSGMSLRTVLKIHSNKERELILGFDQRYHKDVKVGQTFKYSVDGDSKTYEGKISKIYPFANSSNRKIQAEVKARGFIVGLFGEGYIFVPEKK